LIVSHDLTIVSMIVNASIVVKVVMAVLLLASPLMVNAHPKLFHRAAALSGGISLAANLVLIVVFSGYENFVSKIDHSGHRDWPEWMSAIDFTALKIKLLGSIVAISAIQLLKQFMAVGTASDRDLMWYVIIHVVFVVSSVLLALSDRISGESNAAKAAAAQATTKDDA